MWFLWTYHYGILFVVICVLLRGSGTSGGIGGMEGYRYCMWVEYRVVWYMLVCLMVSSSFLLGTLLPLYVYIRTSTDVPLSELPQRLEYMLPSRYTISSISIRTYVHRRTMKRASTATSGHHSAQQNVLFLWKSVSASRCGSSLNGTAVDVRM